ncbi:NOL1/NOP2/sun family protein [Cryptosporidium meleagridis]|uniref:NOL1/NOP2/Sun domain family member 4 n=1 Tax=Cryptosporidium meleagridis TaxID=93969 RepID=A0A2P4Z3R9_9CRYT|nr:NOL1/NOP2/sun family protein [Cryptosporidium meleagridis]
MLISNLCGKFGWIAYHEYVFTKERFHMSLLPALSATPRHIAVVNQFDSSKAHLIEINGKIYKRWVFPFTYYLTCVNKLNLLENDPLIVPEKCIYFMDAASIIVSYLLDIDRFSTVLDLCSAPGGKALIIIKRILEDINKHGEKDKMCYVTCNEYDKGRFSRLNKVLQSHIGSYDLNRVNAVTISNDATSPSLLYSLRKHTRFLKILVDAPCSSDRHLILSNDFKHWSIKLARRNSERQIEIMNNAIRFLQDDGMILYCTCTLNEIENDYTVERICNKLEISTDYCFKLMLDTIKEFNNRYDQVKIILKPIRNELKKEQFDEKFNEQFCFNIEGNDKNIIVFEYTKFGSYILPDSNNGIGPLYLAFIKKEKKIK